MQIHCLEYEADGKLMNHLWCEQQRNSVIILGFLIWSIFVGVGELESDFQTGSYVTLALEPISLSCFRSRALTDQLISGESNSENQCLVFLMSKHS